MSSSDHDIFSAYECLRNDKSQKRFISVLDQIRELISQQAQSQSISIDPHPSAALYLAATSSLLTERLSNKNYEGLPELLRILHIELDATKIDGSIASNLLGYLAPLFSSSSNEVLISLCPVIVQLIHNATVNDTVMRQVISGLCTNTLSDDSRLRKSALQAIYDFKEIHEHAFNYVFEIMQQNPLRALHVAKNLATYVQGKLLIKHFNEVLPYCDNPNRSVRVKALQIAAITLHYLPVDGVLSTLKLFTEKIPDAPGEVLTAIVEFVQSAITMLVRADLNVFKNNFPAILHTMILFMTVGDKDANNIINSALLYGIHAVIPEFNVQPDVPPALAVEDIDRVCIQGIVNELTGALTVQFISIWNYIYKILETLPTMLKATTFYFLQPPLLSSLEKLTNADSRNADIIINFIVACAVEMGLRDFFANTLIQPDNLDFYENIVLPILSAYNGKKNTDDLSFTIEALMPVEGTLQEQLDNDHCKRLWHRLWNALPNCVTTNKTYVESNTEVFYQFIDYICSIFENHRELCRPICKIIQCLGQFCGNADNVLVVLSNAAIDASTSSCVIPAINVVCKSKSPEFINNFFTKLMADKVLPLASDPSSINIACALIDIAIALLPFLTTENLNQFYQVLLSFVQHKSHLQKKALRTLRIILEKHRTQEMKGASGQLIEILNSAKESISSSTVRYRLLLMSTLLQLPDDLHGQMLTNFLPEFVAALKDTGSKTREAGAECIYTVADELVKENQPLGPILSALSIGLTANVSTLVSASIDAINLIITKYYDKISPEDLAQISLLVWKSTESEVGTEIMRSALNLAFTLLNKLPKFVKESQIPNIVLLGVNCIKKKNWEIKGKGRRLLDHCIDNYGIELVSKVFPQGEEKLLRGARKEHNRDVRKKEAFEKQREEAASRAEEAKGKFELDERYDEDARDLNDPRETIMHIVENEPDQLQEEGLEFDKRGRLVLKEPPKKKTRADKDDEDEDEDNGNEVKEQIRQKRSVLKQRQARNQKDQFVAETGRKFRATKGKGDRQKDGEVPYSFAPLSSKTVNKRYRNQMKAAYKKLFKTNQ